MNIFIRMCMLALTSMSLDALAAQSEIKKVSVTMINQEVVQKIENIFAIKTELFPDEGVAKVSFPRNDISVTIQGYTLDPFMGLTSWLAFQKGSKKGVEAMVMGDLVFLEHEVNPAMSVALANNIKVAALHNHFFYDQPKVYFMHIEAEGDVQKLAQGLKQTLDAAKQAKKPRTKFSPRNSITGEIIEKILGVKGQSKEGMFKIVIGRKTHASCGCIVGKSMGITTWAAFAGSDDNAIVDGDFVVLEDELQPVLKALRASKIDIVAIHNHMTHENPRLIFLHYWGQGTVRSLAQALKKALDVTATLTVK